jgi:hypothetical protein
VYTQAGAVAEFEECNFEGNGQLAVHAQGGTVSLTACVITRHAYGAFVGPAAKFVENGTKFEKIEQKEIYQAQ